MNFLRLFHYAKAHIKMYYMIARHYALFIYTYKYRKEDVDDYVMQICGHFKEHLPHFTGIEYNYMPRPGYGTYECGKTTPICWETPITLAVYLDSKVAFGIGIELRKKILSIRQLQGVKGFRFSKSSQDWPSTSMRACRECLHLSSVDEVRLYKAHTSIAYNGAQITSDNPEDLEKKVREHKVRMKRRYDGLAYDLNMTISPSYGSWTS